MKLNAFVAAASLASLGAFPLAHAADGTINFSGELVAQTCTIAVNGTATPAIATVTLPTVSTGLLDAAAKSTGRTNFNIQLSSCTGTASTAAAFFEAGASVDPVSGYLRNTGGTATLVGLRLIDSANGNVIQAGNTNQLTATSRNTIDASGNANLPYAVEYVALGTATAGTVTSSVTYSIDYE
ncbi:fimbrial protein [Pseudomonas donghuensis]|uniref:fimbrial protein n=1 Tax=Pseudomonas donghuensis TaxID=1163398 RepID=UPI002E13D404|nr:fimbrial protein [Pseudomonas donghuensis]